jgi:hypothetical protein
MRNVFTILITILLLRCDTGTQFLDIDSPPVFLSQDLNTVIKKQKEHKSPAASDVNFQSALSSNDYPVDLPSLKMADTKLEMPRFNDLRESKALFLPDEISESLHPTTIFLDFENDIFTGTDYYYTNGVTIGISAPWLSPVKRLKIFPGLGVGAQSQFVLSLTQKMFTGLNPETDAIPSGDHPFAGLLYAEISRTSVLLDQGLMLRSGITVGFTGHASLAKSVQKLMHHLEPRGWDYQTGNSLLLNYNLTLDKEHIKGHYGQFGSGVELKAGNLETLAAGYLRTTINLLPETRSAAGLQLFASVRGSLVLHKASLRGGLWGKKSPHIVSFSDLNKTVTELSAGVLANFGRSGMGIKVVYLSPEFRQGRPHKWGAIQLTRKL